MLVVARTLDLDQAGRPLLLDVIGASVIDPFGNILAVMRNPHYLEILARGTGSVT